MRKRTLTFGGALLALLLASVLLATAVSGGSAVQGPTGGGVNVTPPGKTKPAEQGITVGRSYNNDISRPASELAKLPAKQQPQREAAENATIHRVQRSVTDPVVQSTPANPNMPATTLNFDGIPFPGVVCNCAPPDTNGEAMRRCRLLGSVGLADRSIASKLRRVRERRQRHVRECLAKGVKRHADAADIRRVMTDQFRRARHGASQRAATRSTQGSRRRRDLPRMTPATRACARSRVLSGLRRSGGRCES